MYWGNFIKWKKTNQKISRQDKIPPPPAAPVKPSRLVPSLHRKPKRQIPGRGSFSYTAHMAGRDRCRLPGGCWYISFRTICAHSQVTGRDNILDTLHTNDIEIVSPTFMNQRRLDDKPKVISKPDTRAKEVVETTNAENIMFDKAEQAERQENAIETLQDEIIELDENMKELSGNEKEHLEEVISNKRNEIDKIRNSLHEDNT